jgi:hypothetical protein
MIDLKTVSVSGAFSYGRARVLWKNGMLKVFGVDGVLLEIVSESPARKPGHWNTWIARTGKGNITLRGKCMTCGGRKWWRIIYMPKNELWSSI